MNQDPDSARPIAEPSLWKLLNTTPLGDLLRGRLTGRLSVSQPAIALGLPDELASLVQQVTRRTRLWRRERMDVARELSRHFRDGLDAGRSPEQLRQSFGDCQQAARLIRRSKLRNRPLGWRLLRRAKQTFLMAAGLFLAAYSILMARFLIGRPHITTNFALEMNAEARSVPRADRAWPFYRAALLGITELPKVHARDANGAESPEWELLDVLAQKPGTRDWDLLVAWVKQNQAAIEEIRQGAERRQLGFVYGDPDDNAWLKKAKIRPEDMDLRKNPPLFGVQLPQCQEMRLLARALRADARVALAGRLALDGQRAGERFTADVEALLTMGEQLSGDMPFVVENLVAIEVERSALELLQDVLSTAADSLSENELQRLAHAVSRLNATPGLIAAFEGERLVSRDFCQRIYTDSGDGDGRITREGLEFLGKFRWPSIDHQDLRNQILAMGPAAMTLIASRREIGDRTDRYFDREIAELERPAWEWGNSAAADDDLAQARMQAFKSRSQLEHERYAPMLLILPAFYGIVPAGQELHTERDATLVALALNVFHRQHDSWPTTLDALVSALLPSIPLDPYTGHPLAYRLREGRPLVYTVGPDQTDDGGKPAEQSEEILDMRYLRRDNRRLDAGAKGDAWLWPKHEKAKDEQGEQ